MQSYGRTIAASAVVATLTCSSASAAVFADKSPAQKLRADVATQVAGYTKCLINALAACEKTGVDGDPECRLSDGSVTAPADPKGKFAGAIAKCDAKLDYDRKGPKGNTSVQNYELIGCPHGSSPTRFADMDGFESIARKAKPEIDNVASLLTTASGCSDTKSCGAAAKLIAGYAASFGKCQTACENDYKNKKGNGGPDDDTLRCDSTGDPKVIVCIQKARGKFLDKAADWPFETAVADTIEDTIDLQTDLLFNVAPDCF